MSVAYCSRECKVSDWNAHKLVCAGKKVKDALLTDEKAAVLREEQREKKRLKKKRAGKKRAGKKK